MQNKPKFGLLVALLIGIAVGEYGSPVSNIQRLVSGKTDDSYLLFVHASWYDDVTRLEDGTLGTCEVFSNDTVRWISEVGTDQVVSIEQLVPGLVSTEMAERCSVGDMVALDPYIWMMTKRKTEQAANTLAQNEALEAFAGQ